MPRHQPQLCSKQVAQAAGGGGGAQSLGKRVDLVVEQALLLPEHFVGRAVGECG
jgi:hypothetical protein